MSYIPKDTRNASPDYFTQKKKNSINIDGYTKIFHYKIKLNQYRSTNQALQRIL
jgi:hypothetical protein